MNADEDSKYQSISDEYPNLYTDFYGAYQHAEICGHKWVIVMLTFSYNPYLDYLLHHPERKATYKLFEDTVSYVILQPGAKGETEHIHSFLQMINTMPTDHLTSFSEAHLKAVQSSDPEKRDQIFCFYLRFDEHQKLCVWSVESPFEQD